MSKMSELSHAQLFELCAHLQELSLTVTAANNGLIRRLNDLGNLSDNQRETLNEWSRVMIDIHAASDRRVDEIRTFDPTPRGKSH